MHHDIQIKLETRFKWKQIYFWHIYQL